MQLRVELSRRYIVAGQVRHWISRVGCDEYDRALAATPDVCRPLSAAMGDRRPAGRLLADYASDRARTVAGLASSPDGAGRLDSLARAVVARLAAARGAAEGGYRPLQS
jgi:hypothetical protein